MFTSCGSTVETDSIAKLMKVNGGKQQHGSMIQITSALDVPEDMPKQCMYEATTPDKARHI